MFYVARYTEADMHSRDFMKEKFCLCTADGWSHRGLRLDAWFRVWATSAKEAKAKVANGEGMKCS